MELRFYQQAAIDAAYKFLRERMDNPCIVLPTGAGKTPVIAAICRDAVTLWDGRVLVLAHVKELLEQSAGKIRQLCPTVPVGIYSAGLKKKETDTPIVVAGIQSVHDKADKLGRFDIVLVDEAHLIPATGEGMYRKLIAGLLEINPDLRVIGLTATPFRLGAGPICTPDGILNGVCYEAGVKELIAKGYLSPLVNKHATGTIDVSRVKVERGEFRDDQAEAEFMAEGVVGQAVAEVIAKTAYRKSVILFCQTRRHAGEVAEALRLGIGGRKAKAERAFAPVKDLFDFADAPVAADYLEERDHDVTPLREYFATGVETVGEIYGDTPAEERARLIEEFRAGRLKYLVNVNVLTTGFDAPNVDCVCLLRATASPGLYYQMVGRGFRLFEGKADCLVLDFGTNIVRHGPVDKVKPRHQSVKGQGPQGKVCQNPECGEVMPASATVCPVCGVLWQSTRGASHEGEASDEEPVSGKPKVVTLDVMGVHYSVHTKKGADETAPKTLRVTYQTGLSDWVSEWVCVEHEGWVAKKAREWWAKRCRFPMPSTALEAAVAAEHGLLAVPAAIKVKVTAGERFPEILGAELGDIPAESSPCPGCGAVNMRVIAPNDEPRYPGQVMCGQCSHWYRYATVADIARWGLISDPNRTYWGGMLDFLDAKLPRPKRDVPDLNTEEFRVERLTEQLTEENCPF